jgi:hypothetical protein
MVYNVYLEPATNNASEWWSFTQATLQLIVAGFILAALGAARIARRTRERTVDARFEKLEARVESTREKHGAEINDTRRYVDILYLEAKDKLPEYPTREG